MTCHVWARNTMAGRDEALGRKDEHDVGVRCGGDIFRGSGSSLCTALEVALWSSVPLKSD